MTTHAAPAADLGRVARLPVAGGIGSRIGLERAQRAQEGPIFGILDVGSPEGDGTAYGLDYRRAWFWKACATIDAAERCLPWEPSYVVDVPEYARR